MLLGRHFKMSMSTSIFRVDFHAPRIKQMGLPKRPLKNWNSSEMCAIVTRRESKLLVGKNLGRGSCKAREAIF